MSAHFRVKSAGPAINVSFLGQAVRRYRWAQWPYSAGRRGRGSIPDRGSIPGRRSIIFRLQTWFMDTTVSVTLPPWPPAMNEILKH